MKKLVLLIALIMLALTLCSCGEPKDLVDMRGEGRGGLYLTFWETEYMSRSASYPSATAASR